MNQRSKEAEQASERASELARKQAKKEIETQTEVRKVMPLTLRGALPAIPSVSAHVPEACLPPRCPGAVGCGPGLSDCPASKASAGGHEAQSRQLLSLALWWCIAVAERHKTMGKLTKGNDTPASSHRKPACFFFVTGVGHISFKAREPIGTRQGAPIFLLNQEHSVYTGGLVKCLPFCGPCSKPRL